MSKIMTHADYLERKIDAAMTPTPEPVAEAGGVSDEMLERATARLLNPTLYRIAQNITPGDTSNNEGRARHIVLEILTAALRTAPATSAPADPELATLPPNCEGPLEVRTTYERVHAPATRDAIDVLGDPAGHCDAPRPAPAGDGEAEKLAERIDGWRKEIGDDEPIMPFSAEDYDMIVATLRRAQPPQPTGDVGELVERLLKLGATECFDIDATRRAFREAAHALCSADSRSPERMWCESCGTVTTDGQCDCTAAKIKRATPLQNYADMLYAQLHQYKADFEASEARVAELEKALQWIDQQRYSDRSTVSNDNAWEAWQRLNKAVCAIYDRARTALSPTEPAGRGG